MNANTDKQLDILYRITRILSNVDMECFGEYDNTSDYCDDCTSSQGRTLCGLSRDYEQLSQEIELVEDVPEVPMAPDDIRRVMNEKIWELALFALDMPQLSYTERKAAGFDGYDWLQDNREKWEQCNAVKRAAIMAEYLSEMKNKVEWVLREAIVKVTEATEAGEGAAEAEMEKGNEAK